MASCYPPAGEQHEQSEQLLGQQGQQQEQEQELYMSWMLWYIQHGDLPGMRRLLDSHGFCDFTSPQGLQPVHLAARYQVRLACLHLQCVCCHILFLCMLLKC
jgi:hypothetical protein